MLPSSIRVAYVLRAGPCIMLALVVAMSSRSLIAAFLQFFPGGTTAPLYFRRLLVIALLSLSWGVSAGTAFNLMKGVGANQPARVTATFVRYQRQPKSLCQKQAVFDTARSEIALCVDGFPSKIHPRFPCLQTKFEVSAR